MTNRSYALMGTMFAMIILMASVAEAGAPAKQQSVSTTFTSGDVNDTYAFAKQCKGDLAKCNESLEICYDGWEECKAVITNSREKICDDGLDNDSDGYTDCADQDCKKKPYCKKPKPNPVVYNKQPKCWEKKYNGLKLSKKDANWLYDMCGIELELDGRCMTMRQVVDAFQCFHQSIDEVVETMDSTPKGDFVTHAELQQVVNDIMQYIYNLERENELQGERLDALEELLKDLEPRVAALEEEVAKVWEEIARINEEIEGLKAKDEEHDAKDDELEKLIQMCRFSDLYEDEFPLSDEEEDDLAPELRASYREKCGILADIAPTSALAIQHEEDIKYILNELAKKEKKHYAMGFGLSGFVIATFEGHAWAGGGLNVTFIQVDFDKAMIRLDGHVGAVGGLTQDEKDGGIAGVKFSVFPGTQRIFSFGLGFDFMRTGQIGPDHRWFAGDPDPHRNDYMATGHLAIEKQWVKETKSGVTLMPVLGVNAAIGLDWFEHNRPNEDGQLVGTWGVTGVFVGQVYFKLLFGFN